MARQTPDDLNEKLDQARHFAALGQDGDAYGRYLEILAREPAHFQALHELGCLAHLNGYRSAARTIYRKITECWPADLVGHVNLGTILYEDGERPESRAHFGRALEIDPEAAEAHRGLARICDEEDDSESAARHWSRSFPGQSAVNQLWRGAGRPIQLLQLVSTRGGNIPTQHIVDNRQFAVSLLYAEYYKPELPLPPHDLLFNAIGDGDLCAGALDVAQQITSRSTAPLINAPAKVGLTGRAANAARLDGLTGVRVPKIRTLPRSELGSCPGLAFPLLVRSQGYHTGQYFEQVEERSQLSEVSSRLPGDTLLAIEYLDARGPDGLARKYRVMCIGGKLYPLHLAISEDWKVHYFTAGMKDSAAHRAEEELFLSDMPGVLGPPALSALTQIASIMGLDYAGIDFGLASDGAVLFFEANATMLISPPSPELIWNYRRAPILAAINAAKSLLLTKAGCSKSRPFLGAESRPRG